MPAFSFLRVVILLSKVLDFMVANPVMAISSVVSVACAGILVVNINSNTSSTDKSYTNSGSTSYENWTNSERDDELNSAGTLQQYKTDSSSNRTKKNALKTNRKTTFKNNNSDYFVEEVDSPPANSYERPINSARPSLLNFSGFESSTSTNTTETSTNVISNDAPEPESPETTTTENNFPSSKIDKVKIDADETHYISCRPIEANGPPCMCTYTVVDANGRNSRLEDNCG